MDVGFCGLGSMGLPMARNLMAAGHRVTVWNRTRSKADPLQREGAMVAATPAEAAGAGVVLSMVADDRALDEVVTGTGGILSGLPRGGVHVSMSTIGLDTSDRLVRSHHAAGSTMVSAPVFGRPDAAAAAKLFVVAAGPEEALDRVRPFLDALGQRVFLLGGEAAQANVVKLAGNFMITAVIEAIAEALAVVGKAGADRGRFLEVMVESLFGAPVYRNYGRIVLEERYSPPGFTLPLGLKDNRLLLQAGERLSVALPLASLIRDRMLTAMARGYAGLDWSSFARVATDDARQEPAATAGDGSGAVPPYPGMPPTT